jgi:hypothetical protein
VRTHPSAEVYAGLQNVMALIRQAKERGGFDPGELEALQVGACQAMDAMQTDPNTRGAELAAMAEILDALEDLGDQAQPSQPMIDPGRSAPAGNAVAFANLPASMVGKSLTLGEIAEYQEGHAMATPWGVPDRPNVQTLAQALRARRGY